MGRKLFTTLLRMKTDIMKPTDNNVINTARFTRSGEQKVVRRLSKRYILNICYTRYI